MGALADLRARLAELDDLRALGRLAAWDQRTKMPATGAGGRAHVMSTLSRLTHERATGDELGEWLDALDGDLSDVDRDVVRLARRDWERRRRVPAELAAERARASAAGVATWEQARAAGDFAAFTPALERNVELARAYAACFGAAHPYDALLADYDFGLTAARVRELFGRLGRELPPRVAERAGAPVALDVPVAAQRTAVTGLLARLGADPAGWRIDVSSHPFSMGLNPGDSRITTRYEPGHPVALIATLHEYGHALYERQIPPELVRTNLGHGTSMSVHESQSKLWENHVARHPAFAGVLAAELAAAGHGVQPARLHAALVAVQPSLIRVWADPLTYPLHIVLRFELELALIEGDLAVRDLPAAWRDGMRRLLGVEVPDDRHGVLQDMHWAQGAFGYFPSYALGCLIAAQLWERLSADLGPRDEALAAADTGAIASWLAEHVHVHGRRLDTEPLVVAATGRGIGVEAFLAHVDR